jgi:hypothetical protein
MAAAIIQYGRNIKVNTLSANLCPIQNGGALSRDPIVPKENLALMAYKGYEY